MKKRIHISFDAERLPGDASAILGPTDCAADVVNIHDYTVLNYRRVTVQIKLDDGDPRIAKVLALLERYGEQFEMFPFIEYSDEDRQTARLLWMFRNINENVDAGLGYGTKYDMSEACLNCGTGARQTSALYVGDRYLPKIRKHRAIGSWQQHILVDGGIVKKLKDAGITGISFGDVRARKRNEKWSSVARDQILIEHTMPPARSDLTEDDTKYLCQVCRRGGRQTTPKNPYREEDLVGMQDFNLTWEWFGDFWPEDKERDRGEKRSFPFVLVTPRVMNIFRDAGVKTFQWTPVGLES